MEAYSSKARTAATDETSATQTDTTSKQLANIEEALEKSTRLERAALSLFSVSLLIWAITILVLAVGVFQRIAL